MTFEAKKDPDSTVDFTINWILTLAESSPADTISTSSWTANHAMTVASDSNTTTTTTVWVSGGTRRKYVDLINTVATAAGRTYQRTITVKIQDK